MRLLIVVFALTTACGGNVSSEHRDGAGDVNPNATGTASPSAPTGPGTPSSPSAATMFTPDDRFCALASFAPVDPELLRPAYGTEDVAVVELIVAEECTNLGGQYLLARDLHSQKKFWLGGHGCQPTKFLTGLTPTYGVLRYTSTSSVMTIPAGVCVSFPGADPSAATSTATSVRAVAMFATQQQAEAYATTVRR